MENQPSTSTSEVSSFNAPPVTQPVIPHTKTNLMMPMLLTALLCAAIFGLGGFYLGTQLSSVVSENNVDDAQTVLTASPSSESFNSTTAVPSIPDTAENWQTHTIPDVNLTFSVPPEMEVRSETQKYTDTGVPYSLTLYIEKNMEQTDYYQLYGQYQYQLFGPYEWDAEYSFDSYKEELEPASIQDITISGFPGVEGQIKGERNRFVTYILTDKGMFSLFTAEPTQENKAITDQILATFKFNK